VKSKGNDFEMKQKLMSVTNSILKWISDFFSLGSILTTK